ncbi:MAG: membrane-bound lytic murein transglycosylase MltF [Thermodesulfobacteriota bacterium]
MTARVRLHACLLLFFILVPALLLFGCDAASNRGGGSEHRLERIQKKGKISVLTRNAPTTYYIDREGNPSGPEYDMVEAFAESIGVTAEYKIEPTINDILTALKNGEADLAAAGLTITPERKKNFRFGPPYQEITPQVITRRDRLQPESIAELVGLNLKVIANSSYTERLQNLKNTKYPALSWIESDYQDTEQLLRAVWAKKIDATIADSNILDINRRYYPELIAPINLGRAQQLGWVLPENSKHLEAAIVEWLEKFRKKGRLAQLHEKYYGFFKVFDYVDMRRYIRRIDQRFPQYRQYFQQAAEKYDLPFILLAAQGYQESHWNALARSPTGVRGIMMLTLNTAQAMGVSNRLDPKQSIFGGAQYLAKLKKRFSDEVTEPDRTWLALAAYNVGRGHLHDAQRLARQSGLDPHSWRDIKKVLPLLSEKRYYKDLKYGYARGSEPVRYVQRIRQYKHILENELNKKPTDDTLARESSK